ncbi:MAG: hypothetical protein ACYCSN_13340 [Acidobacteriaceae bacterium]
MEVPFFLRKNGVQTITSVNTKSKTALAALFASRPVEDGSGQTLLETEAHGSGALAYCKSTALPCDRSGGWRRTT